MVTTFKKMLKPGLNEVMLLLKKFEIDFDHKYLFEWYE